MYTCVYKSLLVYSRCNSSVSCSSGRSVYCPRHGYLFSISPYAHTAQELSTRKSNIDGSLQSILLSSYEVHKRRWKRELSWLCMFKMIYILAQLRFELSSLWIQSARHVLLSFHLHAPRAGFDWFLQSMDHEGLFALSSLAYLQTKYALCIVSKWETPDPV